MGYVVDMVVDGADRQRAAFVISEEHAAIEDDMMYEMGRGVHRARRAAASWSGKDRPMLLIILSKREVSILKTIVAEHDPEAILFVHRRDGGDRRGLQGAGGIAPDGFRQRVS